MNLGFAIRPQAADSVFGFAVAPMTKALEATMGSRDARCTEAERVLRDPNTTSAEKKVARRVLNDFANSLGTGTILSGPDAVARRAAAILETEKLQRQLHVDDILATVRCFVKTIISAIIDRTPSSQRRSAFSASATDSSGGDDPPDPHDVSRRQHHGAVGRFPRLENFPVRP